MRPLAPGRSSADAPRRRSADEPCDSIVLFPVNGDCLSENTVNCDLNITRDT